MIRKPRPQGATFLSLKYQESGEEQDKSLLFRHLITLYTLTGFTWNGKPTNIPSLSRILQIPQPEIMLYVSELGTNMGSLASPENIKNTLESIITLSTSWAIQDRGLISNQVDKLIKSQGDAYKPFISAEVTKALKILLDSNKNLIDSYKTFFTSNTNTTNVLQLINNSPSKDNQFISPDQALEIIQNKQLPVKDHKSLPANQTPVSESEFSQAADQLYEEYGIGDFSDIRERRSGTEALSPPDQEGSSALELDNQSVKKPQGPDRDSFKRRKIDIVDVDELP